MPTTCEITFDEPNGVYYSGKVLNGKVKLVTSSEKSVTAIYITINGHGKVRWEERKTRRRNGKNESYTEVFSSSDNYLSSTSYVFGSQGGGTFKLPPGVHEYTFSAVLPSCLPTSFSGICGHIKYEVVVTIDRPLRFDNVFKQGFTVIQNHDLNLDSAHLQPKEGEEEKYFCCCCCASGPVNTKLLVPFGGYAPGQKLKYTVFVDNESNYDVDGCTIKLTQRVNYISRTPYRKTRSEDNLMSSEKLDGVRRYTKKEIIKEFQIPAVTPSTYQEEAIIKVEYCLQAEIETGSCHLNDTITIPIVIGTVPVYASATNPNSVIVVQPTAPSLPPSSIGSGDAPPPYPTIAVPPSFEEATGLNEQFEDTEDDKHIKQNPFIPKYPMYYNFATPSAPSTNNDAGNEASSSAGASVPPYPISSNIPLPTNSENNYPPNIGWTTQ